MIAIQSYIYITDIRMKKNLYSVSSKSYYFENIFEQKKFYIQIANEVLYKFIYRNIAAIIVFSFS